MCWLWKRIIAMFMSTIPVFCFDFFSGFFSWSFLFFFSTTPQNNQAINELVINIFSQSSAIAFIPFLGQKFEITLAILIGDYSPSSVKIALYYYQLFILPNIAHATVCYSIDSWWHSTWLMSGFQEVLDNEDLEQISQQITRVLIMVM